MTQTDPVKTDGLTFEALQTTQGLQQLDNAFLETLKHGDASMHDRLDEYRNRRKDLSGTELSNFLLELAPHIETFLGQLFGIGNDIVAQRAVVENEAVIHLFKKQFIQRRSRRYRGDMDISFDELETWLAGQITLEDNDRELSISRYAAALLDDKDANEQAITRLTQWCILVRKHNMAPDSPIICEFVLT